MKIRKGSIYFSIVNQLLVRVVRTDDAQALALVKHHDKDIHQEEVFFDDLQVVGKEEVAHYMGWDK